MSLFIQFTDFISYPFSFKGKKLLKKEEEKYVPLENISVNLDLTSLFKDFKLTYNFNQVQTELPFHSINFCDNTLKYLTYLSIVNNCPISKQIINDYYLNLSNDIKFKYIKIENKQLLGKIKEKDKFTKIKLSRLIPNNIYSGRIVENFITQLNSLLDFETNDVIEVVSGEDLTYWYSEKRYHYANFDNKGRGITTLGKSCMRNTESHGYSPKLYELNSDKVNMLIVRTKDGKLKGRALLWRLDNGKIMMDRCYFLNETIEKLMYNIGILNGWIVKLHYNNQWWDGKITGKVRCDVTLKNYPNIRLPYLDSFNRYPNKNKLLLKNY